MSKWIKTATRFPQKGLPCLIFVGNAIELAWLCRDRPSFQLERTAPQDETIYCDLDQVEYWMPLPDPPKVKS